MFDFIASLPLYTAKIGAVILFSGILLLVWSLPRHYVYAEGEVNARWKDLRIWATLLLLIQLLLYRIF
jgi:hypothetical protein